MHHKLGHHGPEGFGAVRGSGIASQRQVSGRESAVQRHCPDGSAQSSATRDWETEQIAMKYAFQIFF